MSKTNTYDMEIIFTCFRLKRKSQKEMNKLVPGVFMLFLLLLSFSSAYAQPINNNCSGAITLQTNPTCEYATYTNQLATDSNISDPSCGQYMGADVWFKVVMPAGKIRIDLKTSVNPKVVVAAYSGVCNDLTEVDCSETGTSGDLTISSRLEITTDDDDNNVEEGDAVYIRVFRYGSTVGGTFDIGVYEVDSGGVINDVCSQAIELTNDKGTFEFQTFSTEYASESDNIDLPNSCSNCDVNDIWFTTEMPMSGKLIIETNPGTITPAIVAYKGNCNNLNKIGFSKNGSLDSGGEIVLDRPNLAGEMIYIRAVAKTEGSGTFDIVVLEPRQDVCADAIELADIGALENYVGYTNQYAVVDGSQATCGPFTGKDIWFQIQIPSNGELLIDSKVDADYGVKPVLTVYTGTCGSLTQYVCNFWGSTTNPFGAKIEINDASLANQIVYMRMYGYNDAIGGRFEMTTIQPTPLPVDLVSFHSDVINNEEIVLHWETASELNNEHFIVEHSTDGRAYTPVGYLEGKGTTSERQTYTFAHDEPFFGENYYRLKQVDFDGQWEYSEIVTAVIEMVEAKINVFPNPAYVQDGITIRWIGDFGKDKIMLSITNSAGRQVVSRELDVRHERQTYINFSGLRLDAGTYYLTIHDENSLITHQKLSLIRD